MDLKLFLTVFATIFVAELGDGFAGPDRRVRDRCSRRSSGRTVRW
jgi:hypothetical protein